MRNRSREPPRGERQEARDLVARIYEWLTEGLYTPALEETTLLEGLAVAPAPALHPSPEQGLVSGRALLMRRLIDYARERGIGEIFGHVLRENGAMLAICRSLGFEEHADPDDPAIKFVRLPL
jgi:hypothetical protein